MKPMRVTSEDLYGMDFTSRPREIEITSFVDLPVAQIAPARFPRETIADIERAIVDRGYRYGARKCRITVERVLSAKRPTTRMKASIEYAET